MSYWWDHSNPVFAIWHGTVALFSALFALAFGLSFMDSKDGLIGLSKDGVIARFCSRESPFLPTVVGLMLSIAGAYGMLALVTEKYFVLDWTFFGALLGAGLYVLKRTFSMEE
jgi:hypothetical protein